jgi:hypothetical protein
MSVQIMSAIWADGTITNPTELIVMLSIADHANEEGWCFPSIGLIARKSRMSERGVQKVIERLIKSGKLDRSIAEGPKGTNVYCFPLKYEFDKRGNRVFSPQPAGGRTAFTPELYAGEPLGTGGRTVEHGGVNGTTPGGEQAIHPNHKEPSLTIKEPPEAKRGSLDEIKLFCAKSGIPESDAVWFFHKCEGNGWTNGGKPIKRWPSTLIAWKAAGYLPSQKPTSTGNGQKSSYVNGKPWNPEPLDQELRKLGII